MPALRVQIPQVTPATTELGVTNLIERKYTTVVVLIGMVMFSSLISQITNALNKMNALGAVTTHQYAMLRRYLVCQNVKTDLAMRIRHFIEHCVETRQRMVDQKSVVFLNWLSPGLQLQLQSAMLEPHLRTCVFLSHLFDEDALLKMSLSRRAAGQAERSC